MRRKLVESETLRSIGYDHRRRELELEFWDRRDVYLYYEVAQEEYAAFMAAPSKGTHLNSVFKLRNHRYTLKKSGSGKRAA